MQSGLNWLSARKQFKEGDNSTLFSKNKLLFLLSFLFLKFKEGKSGLEVEPPAAESQLDIIYCQTTVSKVITFSFFNNFN